MSGAAGSGGMSDPPSPNHVANIPYLMGACAVGVVAGLVARPVYSVVGRTPSCRSAADVNALRTIGGGRLGASSRLRTGRPRRRWEDPWANAAGANWLAEMPGRQRQLVDNVSRGWWPASTARRGKPRGRSQDRAAGTPFCVMYNPVVSLRFPISPPRVVAGS